MSLRIDLEPSAEERLRRQAESRGQVLADYARTLLERSVQPGIPYAEWSQHARDVRTLAREQGAPLSVSFEDLLGSFWPEDESADDFIAARRGWRRGE